MEKTPLTLTGPLSARSDDSMVINNRETLVSHGNSEARNSLIEIAEYAIEKMNPSNFLSNFVRIKNGSVLQVEDSVYDLSEINRIFVIGLGKGSLHLVKALKNILDKEIEGGIVVEKKGQGESLDWIKVLEASHPIPSSDGVYASQKVLELAKETKKEDLVFVCVLGGASALLPSPPEGISIKEKAKITELLLKSGAQIEEINAVRKHISNFKGGKLAKLLQPAQIVNLIVVDEVSGLPWGPTVPDETTFSDAINILNHYDLWKKTPTSIRDHLIQGTKRPELETLKPKDFIDLNVKSVVLLDASKLCEASKEKAEELGFNSMILSTMVEGESREIGKFLASVAKEISFNGRPMEPPCIIITGGETTVTISGECGEGGPNQELVLAFSLEIDGNLDISCLSIGTDGTDGPTDIAGGIVDGYTPKRAKELGLDIRKSLKKHESSRVLKKLGDAIYTDNTGTNLMDLRIILIEKE